MPTNPTQHISQYELSPMANAGVFVISLQNENEGHDVTAPHRDSHYLLMLGTHGRFKLNLDFQLLAVDAPAMLLILPGQVHHIVEIEQPEGWAISFDPTLIDKDFQQELDQHFKGPIALDPERDLYQRSTTILGLIKKGQDGSNNKNKSRTTQALLMSLLTLITGDIANSGERPKMKEKRGAVIAQQFEKLLKTNFKLWKQPSRYATELSVSASHLNDSVREFTGKPVSVHIQEQSILEAKRLLYFTDLSAKEIGYQLGYDEPVYFGKLFKKMTGHTPLQFRKQFRD